MSQCFEGYENQNESDDGKGSDWLSKLDGEMPALSSAVRGKSNSFPVYGPLWFIASRFLKWAT